MNDNIKKQTHDDLAAFSGRIDQPNDDYPGVVCFPCGKKHGRVEPGLCCVYPGVCGVCGQEARVTEPRDFGHLKESWRDGNGTKSDNA